MPTPPWPLTFLTQREADALLAQGLPLPRRCVILTDDAPDGLGPLVTAPDGLFDSIAESIADSDGVDVTLDDILRTLHGVDPTSTPRERSG